MPTNIIQNAPPHNETLAISQEKELPLLSISQNDFKFQLTKLEGRALMMLLQEVAENPDFQLYHKYTERISAKLLDQLF